MLLHINNKAALLILLALTLTILIGRTPFQGDPILSCATVDNFLGTDIIPDSNKIKDSGLKFPAVYAAQCIPPILLSRLLNYVSSTSAWFTLTLPLFSIFLTLLMALGLNKLVLELDSNPNLPTKQFPLICLLILTSPLLVYSRTLYSEVLQSCLLVWGYYFWIRLSKSDSSVRATQALIGLSSMLFLLVNLKVIYYYIVPLLFIALIKRSNYSSIKKTTVIVTLIVSVGLSTLSTTLYNYFRYGSFLDSGYSQGKDLLLGFNHALLTGLFGQILSSGKGLIWYAPCLFLLIITIPRFWKTNKIVCIELLALIIPLLLIHSKWWSWGGDWSWGPRFLVPVLPFLFLPIFYLDLKLILTRLALTITAILGATINLLGVVINPFDYYEISAQIFQKLSNTSTQLAVNDHVFLHFIPEFSPISAHWWLLKCKLSGTEACTNTAPWDYYNILSLNKLATPAPNWDLLGAIPSSNTFVLIAISCFYLTLILLLCLICRSSNSN